MYSESVSGETIDRLVKMLDRAQERAEIAERQRENAEYEIKDNKAKIDYLREQLDQENRVLNGLRASLPAFLDPQPFLESIPVGQRSKIPVIKAVREMLGIGLKEAKDLVDRWFDDGTLTYDPTALNEVILDRHSDHDPMDHGQNDAPQDF